MVVPATDPVQQHRQRRFVCELNVVANRRRRRVQCLASVSFSSGSEAGVAYVS